MKFRIKVILYSVLLILVMVFFQNVLVISDDVKAESKITLSEERRLTLDGTWRLPVISAFESSDKEENDEQSTRYELYVYQSFDEQGILINAPSQVYKSKFQLRGSSSRLFPKKQYGVEFYGKNSNVSLLGLPEGKEWVFNGPFLDKTAMRNKLMYDLSAEIFPWSPKAVYFELFLDGEYKGIYLLIEKIDESKNRLDLTSFSLLNGESPFIIKRDRYSDTFSAEEDSEKLMATFGVENFLTHDNLLHVHPHHKKVSKMQRDWIHRYINNFETSLYNAQFTNPLFGYSQYIDVENFVDYYVLNLFCANKDAGDFSTYIYRDFDEKLKLVVWDFNNSFGLYQGMTYSSIDDETGNWFVRLLEDKNFRDKVVARYHELRTSLLSDELIKDRLDQYESQLNEAIMRDYKKWQYTSDVMNSEGQIIVKDELFYRSAFNTSLANFKTFIMERARYLDLNIEEALTKQFEKKE